MMLGIVDAGGIVMTFTGTGSLFFLIEFAVFFGFITASLFSAISLPVFFTGAASSFLLFFYFDYRFLVLFAPFFFPIFSLDF